MSSNFGLFSPLFFLFGSLEKLLKFATLNLILGYLFKRLLYRIVTPIVHQQNEKKGRKKKRGTEEKNEEDEDERVEKVELLNMNGQMKTNDVKVFSGTTGKISILQMKFLLLLILYFLKFFLNIL